MCIQCLDLYLVCSRHSINASLCSKVETGWWWNITVTLVIWISVFTLGPKFITHNESLEAESLCPRILTDSRGNWVGVGAFLPTEGSQPSKACAWILSIIWHPGGPNTASTSHSPTQCILSKTQKTAGLKWPCIMIDPLSLEGPKCHLQTLGEIRSCQGLQLCRKPRTTEVWYSLGWMEWTLIYDV